VSKVLLGKVASKLRDPNYLIKTGYQKLLQFKKPKNGNTPRNSTTDSPNLDIRTGLPNKRPTEGKG